MHEVGPGTGGHAADRIEEKLRILTRRKALLLGATAVVVVVKGALTLAAGYYLLNADLMEYRIYLVIGAFAETLLDVIVFVLIVLVFNALSRLEHEAHRLQVFMDNMYRRVGGV